MKKPKRSELPVEELIRQAKEGDAGALEELLTRFQGDIQAQAKQLGKPYGPGGTRPSDISQMASLRVLQKFYTFEGHTEGELRAWFQRVAVSQATQLVRKATRQKRNETGAVSLDSDEAQDAPSQQRSPSQVVSQQEALRQLVRGIYALPGNQADALSLHYLEGLPVAEIALRLGKSEDAVGSLMQRGVRTLKQRSAEPGASGVEVITGDAAMENQLDSAFLAYLRHTAEGKDVEPAVFAAGYPGCATELEGLLRWVTRLQSLQPRPVAGKDGDGGPSN
ncbi:RNA polymerase sigma factor [Comamonas sp. JC664]|uniref:RNA polymerase sigma factor n=1 Tax=Comamonas sp. JC664 TaxID=2801917 RepID=UPI00174C4854|nr:RNA polymerase sigma factor [Comamonas sp. JC664]MBL0695015.1 sigma-70 family RNA polymerase sigma factor [Comamonas sp. JC664]GHH02653.1 hypothetical protein GCM10012319_71120 [Comamonas sp. KCTC 72670]